MRLLQTVLWRHLPLDAGLEGALAPLADPRDRGMARAIASALLRWLVDLDGLIDRATPKPLPSDARARLALRLGLAQRLVLGTPAHAAVSTSLALLEGGPRRLAHAVLSRIDREGWTLPAQPTLPEPFAERWRTQYGAATAQALAAALAREAPLDLCVRPGRLAPPGVTLAPEHLRLEQAGPVEALPGFAEGGWWVQDLAASLPARLIGARPGLAIADLCAAPGGKTLQLAAAGATVTAVDSSGRRLEQLRANLARTGLAAEVVEADILRWQTDRLFDAVLLDAPCSATGTFRRHPDVLHLKATRDPGPLLALQRTLLMQAAARLRPGGRLVYAVCSLEPAEGEAQASAAFARSAGLEPDPVTDAELPWLAQAVTPEGHVRTLPAMLADVGGLDGFFIARFRKPAA